MTNDHRWTDEAACLMLIDQYCQHFDDGQYESWIDLMHRDIELISGGKASRGGQDALRSNMAKWAVTPSTSVHVMCNSVVESDGVEARGQSTMMLFRRDDTGSDAWPEKVARVRWRFLRVGGEWRIRTREVVWSRQLTPAQQSV